MKLSEKKSFGLIDSGTKLEIERDYCKPIHIICNRGLIDVVFYAELPNMDAGGPGREFVESYRSELCPSKGLFGIDIPQGVWFSIEVKEPSVIYRESESL